MNIKYTVQEIVESAMLVALAIVFDLQGLKIQVGSAGGSISFTMVPLFILCLRVGPLKGFVGCGIVYGLITCLLDGWGFQYYPFDYLLAYGSISVVGFFKETIFNKDKKCAGLIVLISSVVLALVLRFVSHSLSSMIFYEFNVVEAAIYNAPYVFISGGVTIAILILLFKPLKIISEKHPLKSID